jgi:predicted RNA-binding protein with EMAP domain
MHYTKPPSREGLLRYPQVKDLKDVLNTKTYKGSENDYAIEVLKAPIQALTDLPYRILEELYAHPQVQMTRAEILKKMMDESYYKYHVIQSLDEYVEQHPNVSSWYDSSKGDRVYVWLCLSQEECQQRLDDRAWFDNLA